MRTRVLLSATDGSSETHEVSDKRTFFDGERFRLAVSPNQRGYLYVLCQTSQGEIRLLYPGTESGNNRVDAGSKRTLPDRGWFRFDRNPGTERVFLIVAPQPLDDLDNAAADGGQVDPSALDHYTRGLPYAWRQVGESEERGIEIEHDSAYAMKVLSLRHDSR
jgi:hypothetical protein